jgi:hypothetical protein
MKDIASSLPGIDEILRTLQSHRGTTASHDLLPGLALFGAGVLLGAGLALLFAPSSGAELRENIGERFEEVRERINGGSAEQAHS